MCRWLSSLLRYFRCLHLNRRSTRMLSDVPTHSFVPLQILNPDSERTESALILLNQPLPPTITRALFSRCSHRVCSDGGANRLYKLSSHDLIPDKIIGDMDSVSHSVLRHYRDRGTQIIQETGQNNTDLSKALLHLPTTLTSLYILPPFTGRFDHVLACVNSLYEWNQIHPSIPAFLISDSTLCFLLPVGRNRLTFPPGIEDQFCGLLPIGEPASYVTTTGLRWNVTNEELKFGGIVSTSNKFEINVVTVETDTPLLFTCTFQYPPVLSV